MPRGIAHDHDAKRAALRKGAAAYFAEHGYDRASMTGAARHCGISKALIYHYYASKEALLHDILQAHLSDLASVVRAARPAGLREIIRAIIGAYEDADAEHKLQLQAMSTLPEDLRAPLVALQRDMVGQVSDAVAGLRPDLDADRLRAATMTVFSVVNWLFMWHRPGRGLSRAAYADMAGDFVLAGLEGLSR
jgi:AcrR family transcriptional regulator